MKPRVPLLMSLILIDGAAATAADRDASVKIPTKELVGAINNHDLDWATNGIVGMMPERIRGTTRLVINYCGPEVSNQLLAALDDPERFCRSACTISRKEEPERNKDGF